MSVRNLREVNVPTEKDEDWALDVEKRFEPELYILLHIVDLLFILL